MQSEQMPDSVCLMIFQTIPCAKATAGEAKHTVGADEMQHLRL